MKKTIITTSVIIVIILASLVYWAVTQKWHPGPDALKYYRDIETAEITKDCIDKREDVCQLFDCMVDLCWCDDSSPETPIVGFTENTVLKTTEEVETYMQDFLEKNFYDWEINNVIELNDVFFNVIMTDENGDEITYTVAADGVILKTLCGV